MMRSLVPRERLLCRAALALVPALVIAGAAPHASAQQCVAVNGRVLSQQEVNDLQMYCGAIACGEYAVRGDLWINLWTGERGSVSRTCSGETEAFAGGNMVGSCYYDPQTGCSVCPGEGLSC